jgi:hypothetical protein
MLRVISSPLPVRAPHVLDDGKQVESGSEVHLGSARMLIDALNFLAVQVFVKGLEPGACVCVRCAENRARKIRL